MKVCFLPVVFAGVALGVLAASTAGQTPITTVRVASGLARPLWIGSPPGDEDRLFVIEQAGQIRIIKNDTVLLTPFLDVSGLITTAGSEQGLLALAFHPDYANNGFFYIDYTRAADGASIIARYTVSPGDPDVADPQSEFVILGPVMQPRPRHNGGTLAFGPNDGYLYIGLGDGGIPTATDCNAQKGQNLLGKVLRVDVDGGTPYAVPPSNPFVTNPAFRDEIWAYGLRNPWRMSFDRGTGDLYIGDVGKDTREEISFLSGTSAGGENFGWPVMEGTTCYGSVGCVSSPPCRDPAFVLPIHDYVRTAPSTSVVGGHVYRGCAIPDLVGTYFFADHSDHHIWSFRYDGQTVTEFTDRTTELRPVSGSLRFVRSFGEDSRGEIYMVTVVGHVFRIVAAVPPTATNLGFGKIGGNGEVPLFEVCGLLGPGLSAQFILRKAPASVPGALMLSSASNPTPTMWGTIVPIPTQLILALSTDPTGRIQFRVPGGAGPARLYGQWALLDVGAAESVGLSNALQIDFP